jgi:hypothetical protein
LLVVVPLLVYVAASASTLQRWVRIALVVLGSLVILFHGSRAIAERRGPASARHMLPLRLLHVAVAGPLFIYLGLASPLASATAPLAAAAAVAVFLFHAARLVQHLLPRAKQTPQGRATWSRAEGRLVDEAMRDVVLEEAVAL